MVCDFITSYAKLIVSHPEDIRIEINEVDPTYSELIIYANNDDLGKLIGSGGNMINAIKTMINGCKAKDNISYKIQVLKA